MRSAKRWRRCPSDEDLIAFVCEEEAAGVTVRGIELHLLQCSLCKEKLEEMQEFLHGNLAEEVSDAYCGVTFPGVKDPLQFWGRRSVMSPKLGIQYYVFVGLGLGIAFSNLLALLYVGKTSFAETNLSELFTAPLAVWVMPAAVGFIIGLALRVFSHSRGPGQEVPSPFGGKQPLLNAAVSALGFGLGIFLGPIAALVIFFFAPFAGYSLFSHIFFGLLIGGAIGSVIGPLSLKIEQWLI